MSKRKLCSHIAILSLLVTSAGCSDSRVDPHSLIASARRAMEKAGWIDPPVYVSPSQFAEKLYDISVYAGERAALEKLLAAEVELVAARQLATRLSLSGGVRPPRAPAGWDAMLDGMKTAIGPVAKRYFDERDEVMRRAGLEERAALLRMYQQLVRSSKRRNVQFADGGVGDRETSQVEDIPEILEFHELPAAKKWRLFWPELRAYAGQIAALEKRIDADPELGAGSSEQRAEVLAKKIGGRAIDFIEWSQMSGSRLGYSLSGMHRFDFPLGTRLETTPNAPPMTFGAGAGGGITISRPPGGFEFRIVDRKWDGDYARRFSTRELMQIDMALTATYDKWKGRWFAALEIEWDAHLRFASLLRESKEMQDLYRRFADEADVTADRLWKSWA